jgi:hypothetical protein
MRILHYNNIDFNIDKDGQIIRQSTWHVMPDADVNVEADWVTFQDEIAGWAGKVGDNYRVPGANSQSYTEDPEYIITGISFKALSRYMYDVSYTGTRKHVTAEMIGGISESINNSEEREKSAKWLIHADSIDGWLPAIGIKLDWAGDTYSCENIRKQELSYGEWEVSITAKDMSIQAIGNPTLSRNNSAESVKTGRWRVNNEEYETFLATHDINSDASNWAGANYYVTNVSSQPLGKLGYYVTLEAKEVKARMLEVKRTETFEGYDIGGFLKKSVSWISRWRVHKDQKEDFENIVGNSAEEWADYGAVVMKVDPVRINDMEYEYVLEASNPKFSTSFSYNYDTDDRSNLSCRTDLDVINADYILDAAACGWSQQADGSYKAISGWEPKKQCPVVTSEKLPVSEINKNHKTILAVQTKYLRGNSKSQVSQLKEWNNSNRIYYKNIGDNYGGWLKESLETENIFDNEGQKWVKLTKKYRFPPKNYTWNSTYWDAQ